MCMCDDDECVNVCCTCQSSAGSAAEFHRYESQPSTQLQETSAVHGASQVTQNNQNSRELICVFALNRLTICCPLNERE